MKKITIAVLMTGLVAGLAAGGVNTFSFRAGYHDWKDSKDVDSSTGVQTELQIALGETPVDLVLRAYSSYTEFKDSDYNRRVTTGHHNYTGEYVDVDEDVTTLGTSAQLKYNFVRDGVINPYLAAGGMYERTEWEYKEEYGIYSRRGNSRNERKERNSKTTSDDGFAFVGRAGLEIYPKPVYIRLEGAYVSEIYKDDSQAELNAMLGVDVMDNLRLDVSGTYYTDWKEFYILVGATCKF